MANYQIIIFFFPKFTQFLHFFLNKRLNNYIQLHSFITVMKICPKISLGLKLEKKNIAVD